MLEYDGMQKLRLFFFDCVIGLTLFRVERGV